MARKFRISVEKRTIEEEIIEADNEYMAAAELARRSDEPPVILGVRMAVGRLPGSKNRTTTKKAAKRKAPTKKRKTAKKTLAK